jgi:hypothetical protein
VAIIRAYSFRVGPAVTPAGVERALSGLPIGDGILFHRVRGIFEDGHLVQIEMHIGDPVTEDRIALGRDRVSKALEYAFVTAPQRTGLDGDDSDALFRGELEKITGPPLADQVTGMFAKLSTILQGAGLLAAAVAVIVVVLAVKR